MKQYLHLCRVSQKLNHFDAQQPSGVTGRGTGGTVTFHREILATNWERGGKEKGKKVKKCRMRKNGKGKEKNEEKLKKMKMEKWKGGK